MICDCFHVFPSKREVFSLKDAILFWCCLPNVKSNFQLAKWRKTKFPCCDRLSQFWSLTNVQGTTSPDSMNCEFWISIFVNNNFELAKWLQKKFPLSDRLSQFGSLTNVWGTTSTELINCNIGISNFVKSNFQLAMWRENKFPFSDRLSQFWSLTI